MAYSKVLEHVSKRLGQEPAELLGGRVDAWVAKQVALKGGGHPSARAVRELLRQAQDSAWYPGKPPENRGGRPATVTEHQKQEVARVAMSLKRQRVNPSPAMVRAKLPRLRLNRTTGSSLSDETLREIFRTRCYD